ncbi:MAG: adenosylmethionine--8-amino-7-oxononanoate transaminase [Candidatus Omnitrophica bacterium]|nr:adenosylmethionine--8-amino-7-oxononanoate transaminase [Candidatus Omnitrophota bacterium]
MNKDHKSIDKKYLWHPFTQMKDWVENDIIVIERGEGSYLIDTEGKRYIDGVSSLWCNVHGHRKKELDQAISSQLDKIAHSTFLGLSNVPAVELAEKLIAIAPRGLSRVFYSDSGASAVEVAIKMAYQYWHQKEGKNTKKKKLLHLTNSYHGDTLGSVSVGGIELFHKVYHSLLFDTISTAAPYCYRCPFGKEETACGKECIEALREKVKKHKNELAALVIEPVMLGAAGMLKQPEGFITAAREVTREHNVLLICDEVATGFGRTGTMFACDTEGITPDLMAVGKGITGGYLPLSATLATEEIFNGFLGEYEELKTFYHGHTYSGNPLAAAVACANLDLFGKEKILETLRSKIELMTKRLDTLKDLDHVGDIRQAGFMVGIELVQDKRTKQNFPFEERIGHNVILKARERNVMIRPLGDVIILMPPLSIEEAVLEELIDVVKWAIERVMGQG